MLLVIIGSRNEFGDEYAVNQKAFRRCLFKLIFRIMEKAFRRCSFKLFSGIMDLFDLTYMLKAHFSSLFSMFES